MASTITVIQITDHELRLLSGTWPNFSVCASQLWDLNGDLVADLKKLVSSFKIKDRHCVVVIPRREVLLKILQFPSTDIQEISRMLALQIPQIAPFDETQTVYHYRLLESDSSGHSNIVAAIIPTSTIQKYIDAFDSAGFAVVDICSSFDLNAVYAKKFLIPQFKDLFCSALVITDNHFSEMLIIQDGKVVFSHHLSRGVADIEENSESFVIALTRAVVHYHQMNRGQEITAVYMDGRLNGIEEVQDWLAKGPFELKRIDLLGKVPGPVKDFFKKNQLDLAWVALLGKFCDDGQEEIKSFLPQSVYSSKAKKRRQRMQLNFFLALMMTIVLALGLGAAVLHKYRVRLNDVEKRISNLDPVLTKLEFENRFLNDMSARRQEQSLVVYRIKEVYQIVPEGVSLQYFSMQPNGDFDIQGVAEEAQQINALQAALVASPLFDNVELKYATKRKRFNREYTEFKIILRSAI